MIRVVLAAAILLSAPFAVAHATVHIVAFGDSATAGYLVPHERAYPAQLQAALRKRGYDVVVENAGISGDTARGALRRFDSAIGPDTDIAIVEFGTNDLRQGASRGDMERRLAEIVRSLKARHIEVLVIGLGRLDLSAVARANGADYARWTLPPGKYRARDHAHYNAEGYAIVVSRMLPQVEAMIRRLTPK